MKIALAEIITIGDEILFGQILDTNTQWISQQLTLIGVKVSKKSSIGDQFEAVVRAIENALTVYDLVIITGGLGPTNDDITKKCLCHIFDCPLQLHQASLEMLQSFFEKRGRTLSETNKSQAYLPSLCLPIPNYHGTAPGMWFEKDGKILISMPGVPFEMKEMMTQTLLPKIKEYFNPPPIEHQWIKTVGIGESMLADIIKDWEDNLPDNVKLAYLPSLGEVKLRLTASGQQDLAIKKTLYKLSNNIIPKIKEYVYSTEDISLIEHIHQLLISKKISISTAESCTGGYISQQLTSLSGSSTYLKGSIVAYSNDIKINLLKVDAAIIEKYGAVSEQTVIAMAENIRAIMKTDISVASTGIAGPLGGTTEKPVGTVWIALSTKEKTVTKKLLLGNLRENNIKLTCVHVLNLIRKHIEQH
jgi:nicotinamide-nucleotide amidase